MWRKKINKEKTKLYILTLGDICGSSFTSWDEKVPVAFDAPILVLFCGEVVGLNEEAFKTKNPSCCIVSLENKYGYVKKKKRRTLVSFIILCV